MQIFHQSIVNLRLLSATKHSLKMAGKDFFLSKDVEENLVLGNKTKENITFNECMIRGLQIFHNMNKPDQQSKEYDNSEAFSAFGKKRFVSEDAKSFPVRRDTKHFDVSEASQQELYFTTYYTGPLNQQFGKNIQQYAADNRYEPCFNDARLYAGKTKIKANSLILASRSLYLETILKSQTNTKKKMIKFILRKEEESTIETIVNFFYTNTIKINDKNVMDLLTSSEYLQVDEIKQCCFRFLESSLNFENVFSVADAAKRFRNDVLHDKTCIFISKNLDDVAQTTDFQKLSRKDLINWLSMCDKKGTDEKSIIQALSAWVKFNGKESFATQIQLFQRLMEFKKVSSDFIETLFLDEDSTVRNSDILLSVTSALNREKRVVISSEPCFPVLSKIVNTGGDETPRKIHDVYNILGNPLQDYTNFPKDLLLHCSLMVKNYIYCIGGEPSLTDNDDDDDGNDASKLVYRMHIQAGEETQWERVASLNQERKVMGATVHHGKLVVAGGLDGTNHLDSAEMYTPDKNQWKVIASMNQSRSHNALVSCNDFIYALGGYYKSLSGESETYLNSVERLFLSGQIGEESWEYVKPMYTPRRHVAAVCCKGYIYAIGGQSKPPTDVCTSATLKSVEKYDPARKEWAPVASMNFGRACHSACVMNDRIYVVGGLDENNEVVTQIECYDPLFNLWTIDEDTADKLCDHSAVAV